MREERRGRRLEEESRVRDEGSSHKYRTEIPNTMIKGMRVQGLSVRSRWLYVYYKCIAGDGGECRQSMTTIVRMTGISRSEVSKARQELAKRGVIRIQGGTNRNRDVSVVTLVDLWPENMQEFGVLLENTRNKEKTVEDTGKERPGVLLENTRVKSGVLLENTGVLLEAQKKIPMKKIPRREETPREETPLVHAEKNSVHYSREFLAFWSEYPVKKGKGAAWRVWKREGLDGQGEELCASVATHKTDDKEWQRGFIKHPATYLTHRCWEDEFARGDEGGVVL